MRKADTSSIFQVLKAYRNDDLAALRTGLSQMDHAYDALGGPPTLTRTLCRKLAVSILRDQHEKIDILGPIMEKCYMDSDIEFELSYHHIRKDKSNPELLRIIDASGFKSRHHGTSPKQALEFLTKDIMFD